MKPGKLYLIPTILSEGRTDSLPPRLGEVVKHLDYFLVENVRTARRFISSLDLGVTIQDLEFRKIDKNSSDTEISEALHAVAEGRDGGIMSEAGCPGIADPGSRLVSLAHDRNIAVIPLVGPSSIFLALMASGFNGQHFTFHGYLPIDKRERAESIRKIEQLSQREGSTHIFIETPYRNMQLLSTLLQVCKATTRICVARDITGPDEWIQSAPVAQWKGSLPELHKIPAVFLISAT
ncbi:MAG: SAM-dependent methyltransferase [Cyclobacteriaceae bacterium]